MDITRETVRSGSAIPLRRVRLAPLSTEPLELDPITSEPEPRCDFEDDYTDPDPLSPFAPAWAPSDIGQSLIEEWDATADARAARPSRVVMVLRASAEDTAITCAAKLAIRPAS